MSVYNLCVGVQMYCVCKPRDELQTNKLDYDKHTHTQTSHTNRQ